MSWRGAGKRPWLKNCDELLNRSVSLNACRRRRRGRENREQQRARASKRCILLLLPLCVQRERQQRG